MISIKQRKLITSLHQKKYREKEGIFIIEGEKMVKDLINSKEISDENLVLLTGTKSWIDENNTLTSSLRNKIVESDTRELKALSNHVTPPEVLAVCSIPKYSFQKDDLKNDLCLAFESIRDPGNLGTIIRTADWFGIKQIICSPDSVDIYNHKVVQASMGAVMRMKVHYQELSDIIPDAKNMKIPVYGTMMDGENFFDTDISTPGIIVFGNESSGISSSLEALLKHKIRIPDYPSGNSATESLNVASSVAIVCSEIRRRKSQ